MSDQGEQPRTGPDAEGEIRPIPPEGETTPRFWSGRAEVPSPSTRSVRDPVPQEWEVAQAASDRPWWMPILLGILAVVLLSAIAIGLWLIATSTDDKDSTPTPPQATTAAPTPPSAARTSAVQTSAAETTGVSEVVVPPVVGLPRAAAQAVLDQAVLPYRLRFRESDRPPGTVIETDPEAGNRVPRGSVVTLVIAKEPATAPPTTGGSQLPLTVTPSG